MQEKKSYQKYDLEFKRQAVSLVLDEGLSQAEVARRLGLSSGQISQWVRKFKKDGEHAFPGKGHLTPEQQELKDVKKELKRVTMERDILKKTMSLFVDPVR